MPYTKHHDYELISLWVPKGLKGKLRLEAAKQGYKGVSELLREYIYIGLKSRELVKSREE